MKEVGFFIVNNISAVDSTPGLFKVYNIAILRQTTHMRTSIYDKYAYINTELRPTHTIYMVYRMIICMITATIKLN